MDALKVAEKILDIRIKIEEVKALKLSNDAAERALADEVKNEKETGIKTIISKMINELDLNAETEGDKVQALENAVKKLVDFVDKGGEVDFVLPEEDSSDEDGGIENDEAWNQREELRAMFKDVRRLENKIYQIEHNS